MGDGFSAEGNVFARERMEIGKGQVVSMGEMIDIGGMCVRCLWIDSG